MKLHLTLLLLIVTFSQAFSQSNYNEGYVVKSSGDTLKGFIDYKEWTRSPTTILFKINKNDDKKLEFNAITARAVQINGFENYLSFAGVISMDKSTFPNLPLSPDTATAYRAVFLKELITGPYISLYTYTDSIKTRFFIIEKGVNPAELQFHQYYKTESQTATEDIYKSQLAQLAVKYNKDDAGLNIVIDKSNYTKSDIEYIVKRINHNRVNPANKGKKGAFGRLFAGIGINQSVTNVSGTNFYATSKSHTDYSPKLSAGYDIFLLPNTQKFILRGELTVSFISPSFAMSSKPLNITNATYTFKQTNISFIPQGIYNVYNTEKLKAFIGCGLVISQLKNSNNKQTEYIGTQPALALPPYDLNTSQATFMGEAGVVLNKNIEISFTYLTPSNSVNTSEFSITTKTISVGLKYLF